MIEAADVRNVEPFITHGGSRPVRVLQEVWLWECRVRTAEEKQSES